MLLKQTRDREGDFEGLKNITRREITSCRELLRLTFNSRLFLDFLHFFSFSGTGVTYRERKENRDTSHDGHVSFDILSIRMKCNNE